MTESVAIRIHGEGLSPVLIYLPGLHGDWTLVGSFRRAVGGRVCFVEMTYPRTLQWSLEDYAVGVEEALRAQGIQSGWLLGESFGSQLVWPIVSHGRLHVNGVILAGGFVQHPIRWGVRLAEQLCGRLPLSLLVWIMFAYARVARFRYRRAPETLAGMDEFVSRRNEADRQAATHRLHLVAQSNPSSVAQRLAVPLCGLSGLLDPIVPWPLVRRWLRAHCPALREYRVIWRADHNVLSTAPNASAGQVLRWLTSIHSKSS